VNQDETMTSPHATPAPAKLGRRQVLLAGGSAAAIGLVVLAACGDDEKGAADPSQDRTAAAGDSSRRGDDDSDLATAKFAASLEVLAVNTYQAALDAAGTGSLGEVPPAVAEFATVAKSQHQKALDSWNDIITKAGDDAVTKPPSDLEKTVDDKLEAATDVTAVAELALFLEQTAGATYLAAVPKLKSGDAITLAGALDYVDQQRAAVLLFVLGQYPVPDAFQSTEMAASPS